MTWEIIVHGGWRCVGVGLIATVALVTRTLPSVRTKTPSISKVALGTGALFSLDMISSGLYEAFSVMSPGGLSVSMVGAVTSGLGPFMVALVGFVTQNIVDLILPSPIQGPSTHAAQQNGPRQQ